MTLKMKHRISRFWDEVQRSLGGRSRGGTSRAGCARKVKCDVCGVLHLLDYNSPGLLACQAS